MSFPKRTHTCGELRTEHIGSRVVLCGWVHAHRTFGGVTFIDLRDRYGITQIVVKEDSPEDVRQLAEKSLGIEYVIAVEGSVRERENPNPRIPTGQIEVLAE
jgi:aspartyl-tRNA synthetase